MNPDVAHLVAPQKKLIPVLVTAAAVIVVMADQNAKCTKQLVALVAQQLLFRSSQPVTSRFIAVIVSNPEEHINQRLFNNPLQNAEGCFLKIKLRSGFG